MTTTISLARSRTGSRPGGVRGPLAAGAEVRLVLPAYRPGERPKGEPVPSFAVLGRSNVGKSTLLNALLGTKVARVSQTPGRTQALFWYRVGEKFDVVDCPGYGFAKNSHAARESFTAMIEELVTGDETLAAVSAALLLVDGRLEPQDSDRSMSLFLRESSLPTVVAATKWDAVKPSKRVRQLRALAAAFEAPDRPLLPVSAETGEHLPELARLLRAALSSPASKKE
jgi:GTP-binding protein